MNLFLTSKILLLMDSRQFILVNSVVVSFDQIVSFLLYTIDLIAIVRAFADFVSRAHESVAVVN